MKWLKDLLGRLGFIERRTEEIALREELKSCRRGFCLYKEHYLPAGPEELGHDEYHRLAARYMGMRQYALRFWCGDYAQPAEIPEPLESRLVFLRERLRIQERWMRR